MEIYDGLEYGWENLPSEVSSFRERPPRPFLLPFFCKRSQGRVYINTEAYIAWLAPSLLLSRPMLDGQFCASTCMQVLCSEFWEVTAW